MYKNGLEKHNASNLSHLKHRSSKGNKGIIVGFDPGLTAGIAILDLKGNILSIKSFKEISRAKIIKHIISYGKAVLISTDVYPPPKMVKKLATSLNAKINHPYKDMPVGYKIELVESYLGEKSSPDISKVTSSEEVPQNAHQRDALAAAIRTYRNYQKKLEQIEIRSQKTDLSPDQIEYIKMMVIEGTAISSAIRKVVEMNEITEETSKTPESSLVGEKDSDDEKVHVSSPSEKHLMDNSDDMGNSIVPKLKQKIKIQEKQIKNLKNKNQSMEREIKNYKINIAELHDKINKLHYQYTQDILYKKEIASKISLIKKLQDKYNQEKALRVELENNLNSLKNIQMMKPSDKAVPVKIIETFTRDGINDACEYWKIKNGDVVLLKNSECGGSQTASLLIKMGVKAVLIMDSVSHQAQEEFERNMVPLLQADNIKLDMIDQFAIIKTESLSKEMEKWKTRIENKKIKENNQEILKVIDEYRARRKRSTDL